MYGFAWLKFRRCNPFVPFRNIHKCPDGSDSTLYNRGNISNQPAMANNKSQQTKTSKAAHICVRYSCHLVDVVLPIPNGNIRMFQCCLNVSHIAKPFWSIYLDSCHRGPLVCDCVTPWCSPNRLTTIFPEKMHIIMAIDVWKEVKITYFHSRLGLF